MPDAPDLQAIAARHAAASPGPWAVDAAEEPGEIYVCSRAVSIEGWPLAAFSLPADAAFAAGAHADIPVLLAWIRGLERYREALEDIRDLPVDFEAGLAGAQWLAERVLRR